MLEHLQTLTALPYSTTEIIPPVNLPIEFLQIFE